MIVLASNSKIRAELLKNAGLSCTIEPAELDEREIENVLTESDMTVGDIAQVLALAKAQDVSSRNSGKYVIGADQTLEIKDGNQTRRLHKPKNMEEAHYQLLSLQGKTHSLHSAVTCIKDGEVVFDFVDRADLKMRSLSAPEIGKYLAHMGDKALKSVGCYQLEGLGVRLFEKIDGNFHTILGLPLLPLLNFLQDEKVVTF